MKCFWCYRLYEEEKIGFVRVRDAEFVYDGKSTCAAHLNLIRKWGASKVLNEGLMST